VAACGGVGGGVLSGGVGGCGGRRAAVGGGRGSRAPCGCKHIIIIPCTPARRAKEKVALATLRETTIGAVSSLAELHAFIFAGHAAYSATGRAQPHMAAEARGDLLTTY